LIFASWKDIYKVVRKSDIVLEVVDARVPDITRSHALERTVGKEGKKLLIVINKADLIPRSIAEKWKKLFEDQGYPAVYISARDRLGTRVLRVKIKSLVDKRGIVASVIGYPKVGKSSIINALKGKHSAQTSPIPGSPGYTKHIQLYKVDPRIYIIDTPGVIPPRGEDVFAIIRGKEPDSFRDPVKPAVSFIKFLMENYPQLLSRTYKVECEDPYSFLEKLALKRGWVYRKTKEPNIEESAKLIIRDWHREKIVAFSKPELPLSEILKKYVIKRRRELSV